MNRFSALILLVVERVGKPGRVKLEPLFRVVFAPPSSIIIALKSARHLVGNNLVAIVAML